MPDHDALRILTASQHGLVSRRQLADLGFSPHAVSHAVTSGRLERSTRRVFRLAGSPNTLDQRAMAAALDLDRGALALQSAAAMYGLLDYTVEPIHVLSDRCPNRGEGRLGIVHSTVRWHPTDVTTIRGIPVTTPLRTLCDLASRIEADALSLTCDRMLAQRILRLEALHALLTVIPEHSAAPGTGALRRLILARPVGFRPAESGLERRFEWIMREAGEEPFDRQVDLSDDEGWIGRVDFADRRSRVVVEVQSDTFHAATADRERDRRRIERLRRSGWTVIEVWEAELWKRPDQVVAKVRAARARARTRAR